MLCVKIPVLASHLFSYCDLDPAISVGLDFGSTCRLHFSSLILCLKSPSAAPLVWAVLQGHWGSGMCSWQIRVLISTAVEIRDRQVAARHEIRHLVFYKQPSGWDVTVVYSNRTMPSLTIVGVGFLGGLFLSSLFSLVVASWPISPKV